MAKEGSLNRRVVNQRLLVLVGLTMLSGALLGWWNSDRRIIGVLRTIDARLTATLAASSPGLAADTGALVFELPDYQSAVARARSDTQRLTHWSRHPRIDEQATLYGDFAAYAALLAPIAAAREAGQAAERAVALSKDFVAAAGNSTADAQSLSATLVSEKTAWDAVSFGPLEHQTTACSLDILKAVTTLPAATGPTLTPPLAALPQPVGDHPHCQLPTDNAYLRAARAVPPDELAARFAADQVFVSSLHETVGQLLDASRALLQNSLTKSQPMADLGGQRSALETKATNLANQLGHSLLTTALAADTQTLAARWQTLKTELR